MPDSGPGLVGPANAEWKIGFARCKNFLEWTLEYPATGKPVVVVAKPLDAIRAGQIGLFLTGLGNAQIVKAEIRRNVRLVMPFEQGFRCCGVGPLRETLAPPL